jgi:hypothetical protein
MSGTAIITRSKCYAKNHNFVSQRIYFVGADNKLDNGEECSHDKIGLQQQVSLKIRCDRIHQRLGGDGVL